MSCACSGASAMKRTPVRRKPPALASLTTHHATLEDVFVSLTVRQLRDA